MYNILIVEDDKWQRDAIVSTLNSYREKLQIWCAGTSEEAMQILRKTEISIFLLDVELSGVGAASIASKGYTNHTEDDGIALGINIRKIFQYRYTPILYLTAYPERISEALNDAGCFRYILKPYTGDQLLKALDQAIHSPLVHELAFSFKSFWGGTIEMEESSILYFRSGIQHRIEIHTESGVYETIDFTLEQLDGILGDDFFRVHRSYLVNLSQITGYRKADRIIYCHEDPIPLGRKQKKAFEEKTGRG